MDFPDLYLKHKHSLALVTEGQGSNTKECECEMGRAIRRVVVTRGGMCSYHRPGLMFCGGGSDCTEKGRGRGEKRRKEGRGSCRRMEWGGGEESDWMFSTLYGPFFYFSLFFSYSTPLYSTLSLYLSLSHGCQTGPLSEVNLPEACN